MGRFKKLDERELLIRGNVFKHTLFLMCIFLLATLSLFKLGFECIGITDFIILSLSIAVAGICIEMALHDIYPAGWKRQAVLTAILGIAGLALIIEAVWNMSAGNSRFFQNGQLTSDGTGIVSGLLFMLIVIVFFAKALLRKKEVQA